MFQSVLCAHSRGLDMLHVHVHVHVHTCVIILASVNV